MTKNTALKYLYCAANYLTALDLSKNTALEEMWCGKNQLTSLDLSQNTALEFLLCEENQLTTLDLSKNTALEVIYCYQNQIYGENMDAFVESLPTVTEGYLFAIYYENEQNAMTATQAAATKAKGWLPFVCTGLNENGSQAWEVYDGVTDIKEIKNEESRMKKEESADAVFDLSGRRVNKPGKGLYMIGGKKVLFK